ncbi:MAG: 1-(5-phosphoribosyl)-5-[(5-phosphoribosylamino)methylideneamino]imidazole-4-carboxamide isomerase [Acidimicrobiales bacterium]|jgi:phosphoribosylformimino-5-aminoimidazole carboxamide ribotide isomerase|nr:1-(5-phosphoribosyl)-5-[(5-phosphoribosylamino)methylideneamino]imidazole-4-carboxamide isomerase [Actinomycetota bacterium]MCH2627997.1 1-(5-phosphoribosyl)-5-[(5-phosphoribosylamino)methylideneamino]imidazole-4-carboxamide isomerase [Acidimicrobiales bacterium]
MSFNLYPAIDLRNGKCVRLIQGDYDREVQYEVDPVEVATSFEADGASWIHVVDLDAARSGESQNLDTIASIANAVGIPVQCGGGVRTVTAAKALYDIGVSRCVIGTAAVENPQLVHEVAALGHRVAVGLDVRGENVATQGWERDSGLTIFDLLPRYENAGVDAVIVTQIIRDGMGTGSDVEGLSRVLASTSLEVIASGGVGALTHIAELARLKVHGKSLGGVIVGKSIHDGTIEVSAALAVIEEK